ncbi:hypothetical protein DFR86_11590 [Acidianus sulfidivorans JP7]|uniref:CRISPR-associated nuclease/helicase Cas3 domain-containing protein n=1 Tax=Acidianus sulfidivorans JP7 TaxID=619593 RepID=A0A2U9IQ41_9CREN|nr:helicase-related protein [Acidianus sulfidivorans]AWR98113.1 hypothetical protein DFR86_11590 [Acidianus sulfidivorans JP7]
MTMGNKKKVSSKLNDKDMERIILVGTQSVKMGIDYPFTYLYTELSPIDSLIQRMGRVGRISGVGTVEIYNEESI